MRTLVRILAALMMFIVIVLPQPAQAAWNACPDYHFCMWKNSPYWGETFFATNPAHGVCFWSMEGVSSVRNRLRYKVTIYATTTCSSGFVVWSGQSFDPMPRAIGNDRMQKFKVN